MEVAQSKQSNKKVQIQKDSAIRKLNSIKRQVIDVVNDVFS